MEQALIALLVLLVTIADAAKDAIRDKSYPFNDWHWYGSLADIDRFFRNLFRTVNHPLPVWTNRQWLWHALKWIAFYPPLGLLLCYANYSLLLAAFLGIAGLVVWTLTYKGVKGEFS